MSASFIALGGYAQAGKDAVADYLVKEHGFTKQYFGAALEQALLRLNPLIGTVGDPVRYQDLHRSVGYTASKRNTEVRRLLQVLGTEVGRDMFGNDVWIEALGRRMREVNADKWVITGIRFPNELGWVHMNNGTAVWVVRTDTSPANEHSSETSLTPGMFDRSLLNDGTLESLYGKVDTMIRELVSA